MRDRDGFITAAESQALEKQADELLKQDAKDNDFIRANGRGFSNYARSIGITTKKTLETTYKHEVVNWDPRELAFDPRFQADITGERAIPLATEKDFVVPGAARHTRQTPAEK